MRTLKYSAIAVLLVTLTGVIGVLYATQWMSPNRLKPLLIGIFEVPISALSLPMTFVGNSVLRSNLNSGKSLPALNLDHSTPIPDTFSWPCGRYCRVGW